LYNNTIDVKYNEDLIPIKLASHQAYSVKLQVGQDSISQLCYVGDTAQLINHVKKTADRICKNENDLNNLKAVLTRYDYLTGFGKENGYDPYLERKIVYCLYELEGIYKRLSKGIPAFKNVPGLHMRTYVSKIDGKKQYYMLYIPYNYKVAKPLPLVIEMPWVADEFRHFLKGWRVADLYRINMVIRQAEKFGYAYLWSCSRTYNKSNDTPVSNAATFEEIDAVQSDYRINPAKLYLIGTCLGGGNAVLIASRYPNKFAAVGVTGPAIDASLLQPLENFSTLPVYIEHSTIDGKADFATSEKFSADIRRLGSNAKFINLGELQSDILVNFYPQDIILHNIFNFFKSKSRNLVPDTVNYTAVENKFAQTFSWLDIRQTMFSRKATIQGTFIGNVINIRSENIGHFCIDLDKHPMFKGKPLKVYVNDSLQFDAVTRKNVIEFGNPQYINQKNRYTAGPISEAFAKSFIIVQGTTGTADNNASIKSYSDKLLQMWSKDFNDSCRVVPDRNLNDQELKNNNLILIGDTASNILFKRIKGYLKLKADQKSIVFKGKHVEGDHSAAMFIHPNPFNKERYIVVVTACALSDLQNISFCPWYEGNEDYFMFRNGSQVNSGNFDQFWR
jgi:dienelactone hydrolase